MFRAVFAYRIVGASCWDWSRAGRDDGGYVRYRQCPSNQSVADSARTTISASIANEFTEAVGDLYTSSLVGSVRLCS